MLLFQVYVECEAPEPDDGDEAAEEVAEKSICVQTLYINLQCRRMFEHSVILM